MAGQIHDRPISALLFGLPRLATSFCHTALFVLTLPVVVHQMAGPGHKGLVLGLLSGGAAAVSIGLVLLAGARADAGPDQAARLRRRRRQVAWGLLLAGGLGLAGGWGLAPAAAALCLAAIMPARTLADTAALTLLSEHPGLRPVEFFSSGVSLFHFLGSALGAAAFGAAPLALGGGAPQVLAATLAPVLAGLGWLGFRRVSAPPHDPAWEPPAARPAWKPSRPLALFMASRVLFLAGMLIVPTFLLFMVQDLLQAPRVRETAAWLVGLTLAGAAGFAWPAARLTRRMGEVPVLLGAGLALALAAAAFVLGGGRSWALGLASMIVYGAASGLVMTAGISLNMKLLPGSGAGRVMALVSAGTFLAQAVASLAGGLVLDRLNRISPNLGYRGLLGLVLLFLALGAVCLVAMQHSRPRAASAASPENGLGRKQDVR